MNQKLLELLKSKYGAQPNFDYFLKDFQAALAFCTNNPRVQLYPLTIENSGKLIAHAALILDTRLPQGTAFFGFFECPNDPAIFSELWSQVVKEARSKGIKKLLGPISGSIWHQYRVIKETDGSPFFKAEVMTEPYYYELLKSAQPTAEITYHSAYRTKFSTILLLLGMGKAGYAKLEAEGFSLSHAEHATAEDLATVAKLSKQAFNKSWGYTELTDDEFRQLYPVEKMDAHLSRLYLLRKNDAVIGYCGILRESSDTWILKTICIAPEYQGQGLGNFLAYQMHADAKVQGVKKMIYALIRDDNKIKKFPMDNLVFFRRYAAFEFDL